MQENIQVTVICSCFNHEKFVIESLESVKNQTFKNIQLIVIDDCSLDQSVIVIENYCKKNSEILFLKNNINLGITKSFNLALKYATGNFILDLAADDVLLPNCIEVQLIKFKSTSYKNIGLVYANVENINEKGKFVSNYFNVNQYKKVLEVRPTGKIYSEIIKPGNSFCSVSALTKKEVYLFLNGYDEDLAYEDFDFWVRLSQHFEIDFIDEVLVKKRFTSNSLGKQFQNKKCFNAKKNEQFNL